MARAAGMAREAAQVAASAAQYVDDCVEKTPVVLKDGARLARTPTAHHVADEISNIQPDDQRDVWVPFHFLPGNQTLEGDDANYAERLKCRKNSEPALTMVGEVLDRLALDPHGLERLGITAHVFADTFSHFGFSGISDSRNAVRSDSFRFADDIEPELAEHLQGVMKRFRQRFGKESQILAGLKSWFAETVSLGLGHGAVATYPDLPYLAWSFEYEHPRGLRDDRDNRQSFFEACAALHDLFAKAIAQCPHFAGGTARSFASIEDAVKTILATKGDTGERAAAWQQAAAAGLLFSEPEDIPPYLGDEWTQWLAAAEGTVTSDEALGHPACRFHLAANTHRSWVLHELLPARNLLIA
jgi:hypothetical protein